MEEYQKEKILFMYKYLSLALGTGAWLEGVEVGEVSSALFWKLEKSTLIWRKKCPDCGHL